MSHILVEIMSSMTSLSEEEKKDIEACFPIKTFEKGTYLIKAGQIATTTYYVIKGCIRVYELMDGVEKTTAFYTENQSAVNFQSITNQAPSKVSFVCSETTTVAMLHVDKENELYQKHPKFESFCRTGLEKMMAESHNQLSEFILLKPEQRYQKLLKERPDLLNRIPQYHLASYLGIQPETLSRIRKRIIKN